MRVVALPSRPVPHGLAPSRGSRSQSSRSESVSLARPTGQDPVRCAAFQRVRDRSVEQRSRSGAVLLPDFCDDPADTVVAVATSHRSAVVLRDDITAAPSTAPLKAPEVDEATARMMQDVPGGPADDQRASSKSVLLNTFVVKKKRCRVYFHRGTLIWETERPPYSKR